MRVIEMCQKHESQGVAGIHFNQIKRAIAFHLIAYAFCILN
jgi:hypothetical protein